MARRSVEERRNEYLDIGENLIVEVFEGTDKDSALALSHVKLAQVAERAAVTKGALYHVWESQEAFWQDLLDRLLEINTGLVTEYLNDIVARESSDLPGVPTMFDHADALFESLSVNPAFFARVGLISHLSDEAVRSRFDAQYRVALEAHQYALELAISSMGRRLRDGVGIESVLITVEALLQGLSLTNRVSPERTPSVRLPDGTESTLYAVALEAMVVGYTEPIEDDAPTEVPLGSMADIALHFGLRDSVVTPLPDDEAATEFWSSRVESSMGQPNGSSGVN